MQSTLNIPKPSDDPHDVVMVAPDAVRVAPSDAAPSDEELSSLLQQAARQLAETPTRAAPDFAAAPTVPPVDTPTVPPVDIPTVPPVDTTFRPAAVNGVAVPGQRRSTSRRPLRVFMTLLLAAGTAAFAWRSQSDAAKQTIAQWTPPFVLAWLPAEKSEPAAPAVAQADTSVQADANAAAPQPASPAPPPPAPTTAEAVAPAAAAPAVAAPAAAAPAAATPAPDTAQLQSMARDLASLGQEVVQLKASIEQLRAGQQQISREAAKASEPRARVAALPARPTAALPPRPRRPIAPYPSPQAATASTLPPPAAAPYYAPPPAPPPQAAEQQLTDPELASVPRPPMPVR
jgi:hypothetical protein